MARRRSVELTEAQRGQLKRRRDHDPRPWVRERCAALLTTADGMAPHAVARHGLLKPRDPDTVYEWLNWYEGHGFWSGERLRHGGPHRGGVGGAAGPRAGGGGAPGGRADRRWPPAWPICPEML